MDHRPPPEHPTLARLGAILTTPADIRRRLSHHSHDDAEAAHTIIHQLLRGAFRSIRDRPPPGLATAVLTATQAEPRRLV